jgi:prepilin-type N-terminal cleavage/methylation domain-containing protein/prepilin-type processing-associated H-X9-DG protein
MMVLTTDNRRGFTLIEMLVVLLIIVILLGLLVPAIQVAREHARSVQCINNEQEIGKALIQYDLTKGHLPGVLSGSPSANWVVNIFGNLGRMDLWQQWQSGNTAPVKVAILICPSDSTVEPIGGLSYGLNMSLSGRQLTSIGSLARTVLLSERLQSQLMAAGAPAAMWNDVNPADIVCLSFPWPANSYPFGSATPYDASTYSNSPRISDPLALPVANGGPGPGLGSNHRGYINVTFCDGHTDKIPDSTYTWLDPENQLIGIP